MKIKFILLLIALSAISITSLALEINEMQGVEVYILNADYNSANKEIQNLKKAYRQKQEFLDVSEYESIILLFNDFDKFEAEIKQLAKSRTKSDLKLAIKTSMDIALNRMTFLRNQLKLSSNKLVKILNTKITQYNNNKKELNKLADSITNEQRKKELAQRLEKQKEQELKREEYKTKYKNALLASDNQKAEEYKKNLSYNDWTKINNDVLDKKMEKERQAEEQARKENNIAIINGIKERAKKQGYTNFRDSDIGILLTKIKRSAYNNQTSEADAFKNLVNDIEGIVFISSDIDMLFTQNSKIDEYTQYIYNGIIFLVKTKEPLIRGKGLDITKGHVLIGVLPIKTILGEELILPVFKEI